jgi:membrane glycosyltransferase
MDQQQLEFELKAVTSTRLKIAVATLAIALAMVFGLLNASPGILYYPMGIVHLGLFAILTAWIAFGFCVAMAGIKQAWEHGTHPADDVPSVADHSSNHANEWVADQIEASLMKASDSEFDQNRIALLVPIYNEDPAAVMACVRATAESLGRTSEAARFDFFILSDTTKPEVWLREEILWSNVRSELEGQAPAIHYRHRVENRGRKAGNIGEFLERWGLDYQYFVILDADSTMDGKTLVEMAHRMDVNNRLGILQSPPIPEGRDSVWARSQQFSARAYGPLFNWGLVAWTGRDGNYWGHNAMIRTHVFLRHCGLSKLPGPEPLGGEVLSHDFVEAALMRRAGYEVRLAADLEGGYEQCPTTVEDHARRDQRWCQGNLQHLRIAVAPAWRAVSRWHFFSGALSYAASPLWLLFLLSGVVLYVRNEEPSNPAWAIAIFAAAMFMLILPKLVAISIHLAKDAHRYGGKVPIVASMLTESLISMAVAPIMMLYHSRFVLLTLMGRKVRWNAQVRTDNGISLLDAVKCHGPQMIIGLLVTTILFFTAPSLLPWASPLLFGLVFAIPIGMLMASPRLGQWLAKFRVLSTPEETTPPRLLRRRDILFRKYESMANDLSENESLFGKVIRDPALFRLHQSLLIASSPPVETLSESAQAMSRGSLRKARKFIRGEGIEAIPLDLRRQLLSDPNAFRKMHLEYWSSTDHAA